MITFNQDSINFLIECLVVSSFECFIKTDIWIEPTDAVVEIAEPEHGYRDPDACFIFVEAHT